MIRSMYSGVSGLDVNQKSMDVIGNNIANVNTIGFKMGRAVFQDLISQTLTGGKTPTDARGGINPRQVGSGAYLAAVDNIMEPGVLKATQKPTDLGIAGAGMFVVRGEGNGNMLYTRAGDFNFDRNGALTNPSGYRVQGWLANPTTGEMLNTGGISDIVLGPQYQVMQAKASTKIDLSGVLDTNAKASTLTYPLFLTQAMAQQNIFNLKNSSGLNMDLVQGEEVRIKAHATVNTNMGSLTNSAGTSLGLTNNSTVTFNIGATPGTPFTLTYDSVGSDTPSDGRFANVEQFIQEVNDIFKRVAGPGTAYATAVPSANMSIKDGKFTLTGNTAVSIASISGSAGALTNMLSGLSGNYDVGVEKTSSTVYYTKVTKAGENFNDLSGLGIEIGSGLTGEVVERGFSAQFMENNFGLRDGETVRINMQVAVTNGGANVWRDVSFVLTYSAADNPVAGSRSFNTVNEFARELRDTINGLNNTASANATVTGFQAGDAYNGGKPSIDYSVSDGSFLLRYGSGAALTMQQVNLGQGPAGSVPNTFIKSVLDAAFTRISTAGNTITGVQLNGTNSRSIQAGPIDGKGRLSYNFVRSSANTMIDLSTNTSNFMMGQGEQLIFTINNTQFFLRFSAGVTNTTGTGTSMATAALFGDRNSLLSAIQTIVDRANGGGANATVTWSATNGIVLTNTGTASLTFGPVRSTSTTPYLAELLNRGLSGRTVATGGGTVMMADRLHDVDAITGFSVSKQYTGNNFTSNLFPVGVNSIGLGASITSQQFLAVATENTRMVDLFNSVGKTFGFIENDTTLNFNASIGGTAITNPNIFSIRPNTTVLDFMNSMEDYLGLGANHNTFRNVFMENGKVMVMGEDGKGNNIDFLNITAPPQYAIFNNAMIPEDKKDASGGFSATNITLFDEQGNPHVVDFQFAVWNKEQNEWSLKISTSEQFASVAINGASTNEITMKFNSDGSLAYIYDRFTVPVTVIPNPSLRFSAANGTNTLSNISLNLGSQGEYSGMILSNAANTFNVKDTDGYAFGALKEKLFNPAGEIIGSYSNGQVRVLGQIALAMFQNEQGLLKVGDTLFQETGNSGTATVGSPQTGSRGDIVAGMLENSNVDLSNEFVSMIITQRGFQANSRIITTSDEMIQELLNMKR